MGTAVEFLKDNPGLSHSVLALLIMALVTLALAPWRTRNAHWIGATLGVGFYWGREKRDHENRVQDEVVELWQHGWLPLEWSTKGQIDFFSPLAACLAVALLIEWLRRR